MQLSTLLCLLAGAGVCVLVVAALRPPPHKQDEDVVVAAAAKDTETITEQQCLRWLKTNMPARDRGVLSEQQLRDHIKLALAARAASPWAAAVPVAVWLNDVLPYRSVDEPLDAHDWRPLFFERFMPLVAQAGSLTEAAQILNRDIWAIWGLKFVPDQTPEIMSVGQVLAKGFASCTGLSIFLVNACRAVGIPARVAGTPSWVVDRRDSPEERFNNHNWVEVWDGSWSFTGALEFNAAGFNRTWFFPQPAKGQRPGDHWHAIYAASFKPTGTAFPLAWAPEDESVPGVDVTQAYIDTPVPSAAAGMQGSTQQQQLQQQQATVETATKASTASHSTGTASVLAVQ